MAEDITAGPDKVPLEISTEALRKAESYIEAEEGATNRLAGWAGTITTGMIGPVVRRVASSRSTMKMAPTTTSQRSGTLARSVKSSPPHSA